MSSPPNFVPHIRTPRANCKQLNGASAYFDGGLVEMKTATAMDCAFGGFGVPTRVSDIGSIRASTV